jgi:hypothetical protein
MERGAVTQIPYEVHMPHNDDFSQLSYARQLHDTLPKDKMLLFIPGER